MAQTSLNLAKRIARKIGWPVPTTLDSTATLKSQKIEDAMNAVGVALGHYYFWPFLMKETIITTVDDITAGDADVTNASTTVTSNHASTSWTGTAGRKFKVDGYEEVYEISSVTSATEIELSNAFNGTTATDQGYTIAQDEYNLPSDYDGILNVVHYVGPDNLDIITPERMDRDRFGPIGTSILGTTSALQTGLPRKATIVGRDDGTNDELYKIVLDPFPDRIMLIPLKYYALLAEHTGDASTWPFPFYLDQVIVDGAAARLRTDGQDDSRTVFNLQEFFNGRNELAGMVPTHAMSAQFQPDTGVMRGSARRRRVTPGTYDLGWEILVERSP